MRRRLLLAVVVVGAALPVAPLAQTPHLGGGEKSPACDLLGADDITKITGRQDYDGGTIGDAPGEGLGGGTSCQWDGKTFTDHPPMISVILIPGGTGERYVDTRRESKLAPGCKREPVPGVGREAFFEECPKALDLPLFVRAEGANDLVVAIRLEPPLAPDSAKPKIVALAKAALARMR